MVVLLALVAREMQRHIGFLRKEGTILLSFIRNPKDFWSGVIFVGIGLAAVILARDYTMGTAGRMGPAYFPSVLGGILCVIGLIAIVRSFLTVGEAVEKFYLRELSLIVGSVLLFGLLIRGGGLAVAIIVLTLISAYASDKFRWLHATALALGLVVFSVLLFVKALGLPMPIVGSWFGF